MDIAWQGGENRFAERFPAFTSAIRAQDWQGAADVVPYAEDYPDRAARRRQKLLQPDWEGIYGPGGYPGYAPASSGMPNARAVSNRRTPTLEELYAMSDEDFDRNWDRVMAAARGWSLA